jgi:hypothetical protein
MVTHHIKRNQEDAEDEGDDDEDERDALRVLAGVHLGNNGLGRLLTGRVLGLLLLLGFVCRRGASRAVTKHSILALLLRVEHATHGPLLGKRSVFRVHGDLVSVVVEGSCRVYIEGIDRGEPVKVRWEQNKRVLF